MAIPAVKKALEWAQSRRLEGRQWLRQAGTAESGTQQRSLDGEVLRLHACTAPVPPCVLAEQLSSAKNPIVPLGSGQLR
jgi:hypothetical protein